MAHCRRRLGAAVVGLAIAVAACANKKDEASTPVDSAAPVETGTQATATEPTAEATSSPSSSGAVAPTTSPAVTSAPATTVPTVTPMRGGTLIASGEAEVANPWTPAAMQCDAYCLQRARSVFDQVAVYGRDLDVHPFLAESITPNDDYTEWTIKVRDGISFHDGTPLDADAVIYNLQSTGTGVLVAAALTDLAKVPSAADPAVNELKITEARRDDVHDLHRQGR